MRTCVSNRDTDPPIQKLLHAVDVLCIDYYEVCQRKNRANRVEQLPLADRAAPTASAEKKSVGISCTRFWNQQFGFRPGRTVLLRRASQADLKTGCRRLSPHVMPCAKKVGSKTRSRLCSTPKYLQTVAGARCSTEGPPSLRISGCAVRSGRLSALCEEVFMA
jgi:hypothetical protein